MTADYPAILRELVIAGYEGAALVAAFERMCVAAAGATKPVGSPARPKRTYADIVVVPFEGGAPPAGAKAIAQKALNQAGLSSVAVAVGGQLIEHLNLATGRCDPGRARLAEKARCTVRHVHRAIADLVSAGLFRVDRHGGMGHLSAFFVNWPEMQRLAALGENAPLAASPVQADRNVRQNHLSKPDTSSVIGKAPRQRATSKPDRRQIPMMLPISGSRAVAEASTRKRLHDEADAHLRRLYLPGDKAGFVSAMSALIGIDDAWSHAVDVEMQRKGSGLAVLLAAIDEARTMRRTVGG